LLLLHLFYQYSLLLVLAALVLKPDTNDSRTETGHLDELLLHEGIGPRIRPVARAQRVQLLLVEHRSHARGLVLPAVSVSVAVMMRARAQPTVHLATADPVRASATTRAARTARVQTSIRRHP
jgi:hypothetical protein